MSTKRLSLKNVKEIYDAPITFGSALKDERQSRELARSEFSRLLGISIQSLADLEHERRIPSPERAKKIANQIGEPEAYWIQLSFQDQLRSKNIDLKVIIAS